MKSESPLKYMVGLGVALAAAIALGWYLSDLLCPPRGCRARRDFLVNFFLVWLPSMVTFLIIAGSIMTILEKFERPAADADSASERSPASDVNEDVRAAYDRGYALLQHGDPQGAVREFGQAISLDPTDPYPFIARGVALADLKQFEQATADYDRAIALDSGNAAAHYNRGRAWQNIGDIDRALTDFDTALRLRPGYMTALYARGIALQTLGENQHAVADFRQALSMATDDATRQQLQARLAALGASP
jgi:tetratricopeptide (TPR) repeat protein